MGVFCILALVIRLAKRIVTAQHCIVMRDMSGCTIFFLIIS
jgi:hypothetical protein